MKSFGTLWNIWIKRFSSARPGERLHCEEWRENMEISIGELQKMTSPNPFVLITSGTGENSNIMALSWWTFVSNKPPMLAVCLSKRGYTHKLIDATGEFGVHVIGEELGEKAMKCGQCSGRNTDKIKEFGFLMRDADIIGTKLISEYKAALECRVVTKVEASDHLLYMAEILKIHRGDSTRHLFAWEGYRCLDTVAKRQDGE